MILNVVLGQIGLVLQFRYLRRQFLDPDVIAALERLQQFERALDALHDPVHVGLQGYERGSAEQFRDGAHRE